MVTIVKTNINSINSNHTKDFETITVIRHNELNQGKYLSIITTLDRVGKIDSTFDVGTLNPKDSKMKTSYLDTALDFYNKILLE